jgi:hypothetical protein
LGIDPTIIKSLEFIRGQRSIAVRNEMKKGSADDGICKEFWMLLNTITAILVN